MPDENRRRPRFLSTLAARVGHGSTANEVAETVAQIWSEAETALIPVVGREGVAALLRRSVFLTATDHVWLLDLSSGLAKASDFATIKLVIASQSTDVAQDSAEALFLQFFGLLSNLIGSSLAERILEVAWADSSSGETAQDHSV